MRVSLIITTYNNPGALSKVVESAAHQTRLPEEMVIADDGSREDTANLIKHFSENAPFPVIHFWQEDKGFRAAKARNEAVKRSTGEYVILLDGDCVVNRHFIADHLSLAERGCFVQGKRVHVNRDVVASFGQGQANSVPVLVGMALTFSISNTHHLLRLPSSFAVKNRELKGIKSCNMSFFRDDIIAVNGFNEDFVGWGNEDSDLACRFFKYGLRKKVHQFRAICFHLWHPTNKTASNGNKELLGAAIASKEFFCKNGIRKED
ncbi:MAG TPA: glycosyltransferase family 2 protein [Thermodesulfovibrionales bacterium]|nr:glycosyltransferase family 2 protein [Thermodesulfovibrionales bacterium]